MSYKKMLAVLAVAMIAVPMAFSNAQATIAPYHLNHYKHAINVLQQENPAFLSAFNSFREEIKNTNADQKQEQFEALMRFFPAIEEMANMDSYVANQPENGVLWDLQTEVVVSFFVLDLDTAEGYTTNVHDLLFKAFMKELAGGDAYGIVSEETMMKQYNMTREDAQKVHTTLHRLYPSGTLL